MQENHFAAAVNARFARIYIILRVAITKEYCQEDVINIPCSADEILLVQSARYGRMSFGRCVRTDYGYIGCGADVTDVLAGKCAGRSGCRIVNIEALFAGLNRCPTDLKGYLDASFVCVKTIVPAPKSSCHSDGYVIPTTLFTPSASSSSSLYISPSSSSSSFTHSPYFPTVYSEIIISSVTSYERGVGSTACPWLIEALPGQRINITLIAFNEYDNALPPLATGETQRQPEGKRVPVAMELNAMSCREYAVVEEQAVTHKMAACSSHVMSFARGVLTAQHTSRTHRLRIVLAEPHPSVGGGRVPSGGEEEEGKSPADGRAGSAGPFFIIKLNVFGCSYPAPPHNGHVIVNSDESITIRCNNTRSDEGWTMRCINGIWTGPTPTSNCSAVISQENQSSSPNDVDVDKYMPYGMSLLVITVVAMCICLITLLFGLCYMQSKRRRRHRATQLYIRHQQLLASSPGTGVSGACAVAACDCQGDDCDGGGGGDGSAPRKACTLPRSSQRCNYSYSPVANARTTTMYVGNHQQRYNWPQQQWEQQQQLQQSWEDQVQPGDWFDGNENGPSVCPAGVQNNTWAPHRINIGSTGVDGERQKVIVDQHRDCIGLASTMDQRNHNGSVRIGGGFRPIVVNSTVIPDENGPNTRTISGDTDAAGDRKSTRRAQFSTAAGSPRGVKRSKDTSPLPSTQQRQTPHLESAGVLCNEDHEPMSPSLPQHIMNQSSDGHPTVLCTCAMLSSNFTDRFNEGTRDVMPDVTTVRERGFTPPPPPPVSAVTFSTFKPS